jgi:hypothetical protein
MIMQHYDESLAGNSFAEHDLPRPADSLGIGSGSHAAQLGRIILALETPVAHVDDGLRSRVRRAP